MAVRRRDVLLQRINDEAQDVRRLEQFIDAELQKTVGLPKEPEYIIVEFDRTSPEGVDRYSEYVLEALVARYEAAGWSKVRSYLENGNTTIKIWFF